MPHSQARFPVAYIRISLEKRRSRTKSKKVEKGEGVGKGSRIKDQGRKDSPCIAASSHHKIALRAVAVAGRER